MKKKIIGGYYPFNSEIDILEVLRKFEKKKVHNYLTKNKKKIIKWIFMTGPTRIL